MEGVEREVGGGGGGRGGGPWELLRDGIGHVWALVSATKLS